MYIIITGIRVEKEGKKIQENNHEKMKNKNSMTQDYDYNQIDDKNGDNSRNYYG